MSMCPPNEDRIRREIENYTIKDWIDTDDVKQLEVIASTKEAAQTQVVRLDGDSDDEDVQELQRTAKESGRPQYEHGRTTFRERMGSLWHRRTKTDKIISLYYDMEPSPKPKATRTKKACA